MKDMTVVLGQWKGDAKFVCNKLGGWLNNLQVQL
jgi:hypothetical protein